MRFIGEFWNYSNPIAGLHVSTVCALYENDNI